MEYITRPNILRIIIQQVDKSRKKQSAKPEKSDNGVAWPIKTAYSEIFLEVHRTRKEPSVTRPNSYRFSCGTAPSGSNFVAAQRSAFTTTARLARIVWPFLLSRTPTAFPSSTKTFGTKSSGGGVRTITLVLHLSRPFFHRTLGLGGDSARSV